MPRAITLPILYAFLALAQNACIPEQAPSASHRPSQPKSSTAQEVPSGPVRPAPNPAPVPPSHLKSIIPSTPSSSAGTTKLAVNPFTDDFERTTLGQNWQALSDRWRIDRGRLCAQGAHNAPIWLVPRLTRNARIDFDASSDSPDGDLKAEAWGDGRSKAEGTAYNNATSYLIIYGGWRNTYHVLARLNEHAPNRREIRIDPNSNDYRARPVLQGRTYHFKIERSDAKTVRYWVDDIEILSMPDEAPLLDAGHEHFGFNNWETPVCFDNLVITPLKG